MRWNPSEVRDAIGEAESFIAILDHNGHFVDQGRDPEETYAKAAHYSPTGTVLVDKNVWASGARQNEGEESDYELGKAAMRAVQRSSIIPQQIDYRALGTFGSTEYNRKIRAARALLRDVAKPAYEKILRETVGTIHRGRQGSIAKSFDGAWLAGDHLRENTKTKKVLATSDANYGSYGLSLVPHGAAFRGPFSTETDQGPGGKTFCLHSTKECRLTCLVNTGQRALESGAFAASYLFSQLLINPDTTRAFLTNLYDRCITQMVSSYQKDDVHMFLRLNMMSDLPWEIIAPGLVEQASEVAREICLGGASWNWKDSLGFYDYSKIPYRPGIPDYYDLTYSYSGKASRSIAPKIFAGEPGVPRRMAIVFIERLSKSIDIEGRQSFYADDPGYGLKQEDARYFPFTYFGHEVWNGDLSDIRPLDPANVKVVGLAYKVSRYKVWPEEGELNNQGKQKVYRLKSFVESADIDSKLPFFMVRVHRPDPDGPLVVMQTQDPTAREIVLPLASEPEPELKQLTGRRRR